MLKKIGLCFLFAQKYHAGDAVCGSGAARNSVSARCFNILGPLSNPAGANMELMGVYDASLVEPLAQVMANLGVVRGNGCLRAGQPGRNLNERTDDSMRDQRRQLYNV